MKLHIKEENRETAERVQASSLPPNEELILENSSQTLPNLSNPYKSAILDIEKAMQMRAVQSLVLNTVTASQSA